MSDRSSAYLFSQIFQIIDDYVEDEDARHDLSRRIYSLSREHDFEIYQMDCDDVLVNLGLAHYATDPETGEDTIRYEGE